MKRLVVLITVLTLLTTAVPVSHAATTDSEISVSPYLLVISNAFASSSLSGSTLTAKTEVSTKSNTTIKVTMKVQKKSGSDWITVKTWEKTSSNTDYLSYKETYTVSSGTYRVSSIIKAGDESIIRVSGTVTK